MRGLIPWRVALGLMLAGCTVPSWEELARESAVKVVVSFDFKAGCISVRATPAATSSRARQTCGAASPPRGWRPPMSA